jgi:hypothetical protein
LPSVLNAVAHPDPKIRIAGCLRVNGAVLTRRSAAAITAEEGWAASSSSFGGGRRCSAFWQFYFGDSQGF